MDAANIYDELYQTKNFFRFRTWLYAPFIGALFKKAEVSSGAQVLDVGSGQGQFSILLAKQNFEVTGIDDSQQGVNDATAASIKEHVASHGPGSCHFVVGDAMNPGFPHLWDAVFCRAFALYHDGSFGPNGCQTVTAQMLSYLKPGGKLIWTYPSRLSPSPSQRWRWHSLKETKAHFAPRDAKVYFSLRIETLIFGRFAFNPVFSWLAATVCKLSSRRLGGELVAIVTRPLT
jgi:SAM-dependent methyltransferase